MWQSVSHFMVEDDRGIFDAVKTQAMLRRTYDFAGTVPILEHWGAFLNTGDSTLTYEGSVIDLTKNQFRILSALMEHKGAVVSFLLFAAAYVLVYLLTSRTYFNIVNRLADK